MCSRELEVITAGGCAYVSGRCTCVNNHNYLKQGSVTGEVKVVLSDGWLPRYPINLSGFICDGQCGTNKC